MGEPAFSGTPFLKTSRKRWALLDGFDEWCLGTGSDGRRASVSWTVRMCFARASERVKARSHSERLVSMTLGSLKARTTGETEVGVASYLAACSRRASPEYGSAYVPAMRSHWHAGCLSARNRSTHMSTSSVSSLCDHRAGGPRACPCSRGRPHHSLPICTL